MKTKEYYKLFSLKILEAKFSLKTYIPNPKTRQKKIFLCNQVNLKLEVQGWFKISKSTYVIHPINQLKYKSHSHLIKCRKALWKKNPILPYYKIPEETWDAHTSL